MSSSDEKGTGVADRIDLEDGLRFLHTLGMQSKVDLVDVSSRVLALVEELIASGTLDLRSFEARRATIDAREAERMTSERHVRVAVDQTSDKYALTDLPQINCADRLHLCKAKCCTLAFPLSFQDLDERVIRWDYGAPYRIRQREDGYCTHNDTQTHHCTAYEQRPAICRTYDCRKDERIWRDFERGIPATDAPD